MNDTRLVDCFICHKHRGDVAVPGGTIYENGLIFISHTQPWGTEQDCYLGHVLIEPKRHVAELADLSEKESQIIGLYIGRIASALLQMEGMVHIYTFVIGDDAPHLHVHVIGRYADTPREFWGARVDEWPGAPRGKTPEIEQVADRLRAFLIEHYG